MAQGLPSFLRKRVVFYAQAVQAARQVGAFSETSRAVAEAVAAPIERRGSGPLRVLEVGAGTGALTRSIVARLGAGDRLDLYEINHTFADFLRKEFASRPDGPRIEVFETDVETFPEDARYDVIVSSLPLMNLPPEKVRRVFERYERALTPGGTISYYDYWAKELRCLVQWGDERRRMLRVLDETKQAKRRFECRRRIVLANVPPANVHHLRLLHSS
jgi:phosphatidylethanolamine/phosphatidyl-N-methylethanolamine N-methyltransferase